MDKTIYLKFYNFTKNNPLFEKVISFVSKISATFFFTVYTFVGLYLLVTGNRQIILFIAVPLAVLFTVLFLNRLVKRTRPYETLNVDTMYSSKKKGYSFPSKHASSASIIAFSCLFVYPPLGYVMWVIALITGLSRIFTGGHYPSDVLFGFCISALFSFIGYSILPHIAQLQLF